MRNLKITRRNSEKPKRNQKKQGETRGNQEGNKEKP